MSSPSDRPVFIEVPVPPGWLEFHAALLALTDSGDPLPCTEYPLEGWLSPDVEDQKFVARLCARCPALAACRAYGIDNPRELGVYGGLTRGQRRAIARGGRG